MPENLNITFAKNWTLGGPIALDSISNAAQKKALQSADKNGDGLVTMREARDRLIVGGKGLTDADSNTFKAQLEAFLLAKTGFAIDTFATRASARSHVMYVQLNNEGNANLREAQDMARIVAQDPDRPALDTLNWTRAFNTEGDEDKATRAFRASCIEYFDKLIANKERLTAFVISGHSSGDYMLQEIHTAGGGHYYAANLDPRAVLMEIRNSDPKYARLFDGCEKVAALACFQGGSATAWAGIFPNAAFGGTQGFAPSSASAASAAIYDGAATAHQTIEDATGDGAAATTAALAVPYASGLRTSDPVFLAPEDPAQKIARTTKQLSIAKAAYDRVAAEIAAIRASGGTGVAQARLDQTYAIANTYYLALSDAWAAKGGATGADAQAIARAEFERRDLFAIRKHQDRPNS